MQRNRLSLNTLKLIASFIFVIVLLFQINFLTAYSQTRSTNAPKICTELFSPGFQAGGEKDFFWKKKILTVSFLNGSQFLKDKVKQYASVWSRYADIKFNFVQSEDADIRVAFKYKRSAGTEEDTGSWSYIGTHAQNRPVTEPTMNFGWFDETTDDEEFRRVILHEFGHALGMIHEHEAPLSSIRWNKPAVYDYYEQKNGWNREMVDNNIFRKYDRLQTQFTDYDPTSIMHYPVPKELILGGTEIGWNINLSENDKLFISSIYPRAKLSVYKVSAANVETPISTNQTQLILQTNDRFKVKIAAPFHGYAYVISNSVDGTFLVRPYNNGQSVAYNQGQLISLGFKVSGEPSQENVIVIFTPTELKSTKLQAMLNSTTTTFDKERMRLPNPTNLPSVTGIGAVTSLTCSYMTNWLGVTLGNICDEAQANPTNQPVFLRISYSHQ